MNISDLEILHRLGNGDSIEQICSAAEIDRDHFEGWWKSTIESRVPDFSTSCQAINGTATLTRDERGIPSITADNDDDLFFGYGVAMAEDRLFQLDYLRRKAKIRYCFVAVFWSFKNRKRQQKYCFSRQKCVFSGI